jgi:hypothetical protein
MNDVSSFMTYSTLVDMLERNRRVDRSITYIGGENTERRIQYGDVYTRALGILHHLQTAVSGRILGCHLRRHRSGAPCRRHQR